MPLALLEVFGARQVEGLVNLMKFLSLTDHDSDLGHGGAGYVRVICSPHKTLIDHPPVGVVGRWHRRNRGSREPQQKGE